jgi:chromosome segregation ATPase
MMAMADSSQSEQVEKLMASHNEDIARIKSEAESSANELRAVHDNELSALNEKLSALMSDNERLQNDLASERLSVEQQLQSLRDERESELNKLKEQFETSGAEQTSALEKLQAAFDEEKSALIRNHEEQLKVMEEKLANAQQSVNDEIASELDNTKKELEEKQTELETSQKKAAQFQQVANKIKKAAADKIKSLADEHACAVAEAEKSHNEKLSILQNELDTLRESTEGSTNEIEQLKSSLEESIAERESLLKELEDAKRAATSGLDEKMKLLAAKQAALTMQLNQDHDEAIAKIHQDHENTIGKLEAQHKSKLEDQQKENDANKAKLQQMMAKHADDLKDHYDKKCKSIQDENSAVLKRKEDELNELKKKISHLMDELKAQKSEMDKLTTELSNSSNAASASANAMLEEQNKLQQQIKDLNADKVSMSNQKEELSGKLKALSGNLVALAEEKKDLEEQLERSTKLVNKYKNAESQLNVLQQENNALKLEQTKTNSVLAKLNQERDDNERKHGQRTALVGMLEEQVADLNDSLSETKAKLEATSYDISQKDEEIESLRKDLEKTESALKNAESKAAESAAAAQQNTEKDSIQKSKTIKSLQAQVENLSSQMKKKSAAAQKILKEREAECIELRKTNKYLQNEVDKGSLSDRRIFELAEQQSNRETAAVAEIEIRERQIAQLTQQLEKHDANLATAEIDKEKAEDQVESLARVHRREGVNMDYLKSIVVQYLAKPPGSSERTALLPVLATLLQFDDNDYKAIEEGKQKVSWWGDIIPTYIGGSEAPTPAPRLPHPASVMPTSAEVTISNTLSQNVPKTTSLQF